MRPQLIIWKLEQKRDLENQGHIEEKESFQNTIIGFEFHKTKYNYRDPTFFKLNHA